MSYQEEERGTCEEDAVEGGKRGWETRERTRTATEGRSGDTGAKEGGQEETQGWETRERTRTATEGRSRDRGAKEGGQEETQGWETRERTRTATEGREYGVIFFCGFLESIIFGFLFLNTKTI